MTENLALWHLVEKTDPAHVKAITGKSYKGTSPKPHWIVMKAMEKDRQRRYATAHGLAADVQRHLRHESVSAGPPSRRYRLRKLIRRNKAAFTAGGFVVLALAIGFGTSTWRYLREKEARGEADRARANEAALRERAEFREALAHTRRLRRRPPPDTPIRTWPCAAHAKLAQDVVAASR